MRGWPWTAVMGRWEMMSGEDCEDCTGCWSENTTLECGQHSLIQGHHLSHTTPALPSAHGRCSCFLCLLSNSPEVCLLFGILCAL